MAQILHLAADCRTGSVASKPALACLPFFAYIAASSSGPINVRFQQLVTGLRMTDNRRTAAVAVGRRNSCGRPQDLF